MYFAGGITLLQEDDEMPVLMKSMNQRHLGLVQERIYCEISIMSDEQWRLR